MGQARNRGTFEERKAQSIARREEAARLERERRPRVFIGGKEVGGVKSIHAPMMAALMAMSAGMTCTNSVEERRRR